MRKRSDRELLEILQEFQDAVHFREIMSEFPQEEDMTFGQAVEAMKRGKKVKREHWGGYWRIEEWDKYSFGESVPLIVAYLKNGSYAPAAPYQEDILAEDWRLAE
jgi:hypothetical protein